MPDAYYSGHSGFPQLVRNIDGQWFDPMGNIVVAAPVTNPDGALIRRTSVVSRPGGELITVRDTLGNVVSQVLEPTKRPIPPPVPRVPEMVATPTPRPGASDGRTVPYRTRVEHRGPGAQPQLTRGRIPDQVIDPVFAQTAPVAAAASTVLPVPRADLGSSSISRPGRFGRPRESIGAPYGIGLPQLPPVVVPAAVDPPQVPRIRAGNPEIGKVYTGAAPPAAQAVSAPTVSPVRSQVFNTVPCVPEQYARDIAKSLKLKGYCRRR